jgi:rhodanese-related sulfurtransferase
MTTKRVDPKEARVLMEQGWTYVDVRTEAEFDGGHPAGAINIPINSPDFVAVMKARFPVDAKLVVGCLMGGRSARACQVLESQGYQQLADQTGGWGGQRDGLGRVVVPGWVDAQLPVGGGVRYTDVLKNK